MLDPVLYFGAFRLPVYSLMLLVAVVTAFVSAVYRSPYRFAQEIDVALAAVVLGLIGARLEYVALAWDYFAAHPAELLHPELGGLGWHGAVIGAYTGMALMARWRGLDRRELLSRGAWALPLIALAGWVGCAAAGCGYGREVDTLANYADWLVWETRDVYGILAPRYATARFGVALAVVVALVGALTRRERRVWVMLALLSAAIFLRDPPRLDAPGSTKGRGIIAGLRDIIAVRALWFIIPITLVSYAMLATTRGLWVAPFLSDVSGLSRIEQGNATMIMAITMTVGAVLYGVLEKRLGGPKPTVLYGNIVFAALYAALALFGDRSAFIAVTLFALIGLAGFNYGILMAHARLFFPDHLIGRGVTFMNFFFIAGAAVVQALSGWLIGANRAAGIAPAASFAELHWWFAGTLALCVALYMASPARPAAQK
ncbi:MAG: prolipoprotein diacylglyceryl transferase [Anaerolineae bacterium]|nr:prolipoprotein diacylglyceryl transferase [Anaerolineae bacterium]